MAGWIERRRNRALAAKINALLSDPNARRTTRKGWEGTTYLIDPINPGIAIAVRPTQRKRFRSMFTLAR